MFNTFIVKVKVAGEKRRGIFSRKSSCVSTVYSFGELKHAFKWTYLFHKQVKQVLDEILEKLPDEFNVPEMMARVEDRTPYTVVAFQECERMNILTSEIKRSLKELDLGLKVSPEF